MPASLPAPVPVLLVLVPVAIVEVLPEDQAVQDIVRSQPLGIHVCSRLSRSPLPVLTSGKLAAPETGDGVLQFDCAPNIYLWEACIQSIQVLDRSIKNK